ncbi:MAG: LysM peptidoglycan-binding domain-containing protein [Gloeotrichia echinulata DEX184]|nr:LysM peptidoglycan-binding domain-containing protein [Gloeotrichia echinulata DEX184]
MREYTVQGGDTLGKIAKKFYGDGSMWTVIYERNRDRIGNNPDFITPGLKLIIPPQGAPPIN